MLGIRPDGGSPAAAERLDGEVEGGGRRGRRGVEEVGGRRAEAQPHALAGRVKTHRGDETARAPHLGEWDADELSVESEEDGAVLVLIFREKEPRAHLAPAPKRFCKLPSEASRVVRESVVSVVPVRVLSPSGLLVVNVVIEPAPTDRYVRMHARIEHVDLEVGA